MANPVLQFLITARDEATAAFGKIFGFLDKTTSATANLIREKFTGLFGGGLDGAIEFEAQLSRVAAKGGFTADEMATLKKAAAAIAPTASLTCRATLAVAPVTLADDRTLILKVKER